MPRDTFIGTTPTARATLARHFIRPLVIVFGWTAAHVVYGSQSYFINLYFGRQGNLQWLVLIFLVDGLIWAALTLPSLELTERFPLDRNRWRRALLVLFPASVVISILQVLIYFFIGPLFGYPATLRSMSRRTILEMLLINDVPTNLVKFWILVCISNTITFYRNYRDRELRASQLEAQLAQAQLQVLRMQLHPHFLFNTLHAISALMHRDVAAADRMIARLSDLLRITLANIGAQELPLKQELEFLDRYLDIEEVRFQDRLTVVRDIDPAALDGLVPYLILQPLVENAIRYGIAARTDGGRIEIRARREGGMLSLEVRDNGPGLPADPEAALHGQGIGIANTKTRIEQLYGRNASFRVVNATGGGVVAWIEIPWRCEQAAADISDASATNRATLVSDTRQAGPFPLRATARAARRS